MPANEYYDSTGAPSTGSAGSSATMRAEFDLIEAAFNKLPTMTGAGGEFVTVDSGEASLSSKTAAEAKALLGVDQVDNTSDTNKPVSTATQTLVDGRVASPVNKIVTVSGSGGAIAIDVSAGDTFLLTLSSAATISFTDYEEGKPIVLRISNGAVGVTWSAGFVWPYGVEPTLTSGVDRVAIQKMGTSSYDAAAVGQSYA